MNFHKIGLYGLGLIGGSLAKTIHHVHPKLELTAYDIDPAAITQALDEKILMSKADLNEFASCDLIFLCAPVHTNIEFLEQLRPVLRKECLLSDVGSVKGGMHEKIAELGLEAQFIGGHPMAGSERSGFLSSSDHLFENVFFLLTPTEKVDEQLVADYRDFIESLHSIPLILSPEYHDFVTAAISHVPHVLAASLVNMVRDLDSSKETMKLIAAGGFKDITRIASSSPTMWEQICMTNREQILLVLNAFQKQIEQITCEIQAQNKDEIYDFFASSKNYRDSFSNVDRGPLKKVHYMYCDLIDEAGGIANVAQILAVHHINIKNIGIIHNREYEDGVLRIEFYEEDSVALAVKLLKKYHYTVYEPKN